MSKNSMEKALFRYQKNFILYFFFVNMFLPMLYILYLKKLDFNYIDTINIGNIIFKSLELATAVFIPIVAIDILYYQNLDDNSPYKNRIKKVYSSNKIIKFNMLFVIMGFTLIMHSVNIREWIAVLYNKTSYLTEIEKIEVACLKFGSLLLIMGVISVLYSIKNEYSRNEDIKRNTELNRLTITLVINIIIFLILGVIFNRINLLCSLFINIAASMITILFTVRYVDKLLKKSEDKKKEEEQKLRIYEEWKFEFMNDKQQTIRHIHEVREMIAILIEYYSEAKCTMGVKNKNPMTDLLKLQTIDLVKAQLRIKLANPPLRYSFKYMERVIVINNEQTIYDTIQEVNNCLEDAKKYINSNELTTNQLKRHSGQLAKSSIHLLKLIPKEFEDVKDDIKH